MWCNLRKWVAPYSFMLSLPVSSIMYFGDEDTVLYFFRYYKLFLVLLKQGGEGFLIIVFISLLFGIKKSPLHQVTIIAVVNSVFDSNDFLNYKHYSRLQYNI